MRKLCSLLMVFLLISTVLQAQKKVVNKKNPNTPVSINTITGKKMPVPALRPFSFTPNGQKVMPKKKVTVRNNSTFRDPKFARETRRVEMSKSAGENQRGSKSFRDLNIYYPSNQSGAIKKEIQRKRLTYASITVNTQSEIDAFNVTYPDCDAVGSLVIDGATINSLATLNNIGSVGSIIIKNTSLTDLSDLQGLGTIYDSLVLENNASLTGIELSNVSTLGGLYVRNCGALTTIDAFGPSLTDVANDIRIENSGVTSLEGLTNITDIGGDFAIKNTPIQSLAEMDNLQTVHYLYIEDNLQLTEIGMTGITSMWGFIIQSLPKLTHLNSFTQNLGGSGIGTLWLGNMETLTDISGLEGISSVANIIIYGCQELTDLQGLENITEAHYGISLYNNALQDISALSGITTVEYDKVEIAWTNNLSNLQGLENITKMDALWIYHNDALTNLSDLNPALEIYNLNGDDLQIYNNSQLSFCSVPAICNYLNSSNATNPQIYSNAGNCGDLASVMASCGNSGCTILENITWNGSDDEDWDNPLNWTPNRVPDECSLVIIPSDLNDYPNVYHNNDISIGGLKMNSASLYLNGVNLTIGDSVSIHNSDIQDVGYITLSGSTNPRITYSSFDCYELNIVNYKGGSHFYGNSVYGDVSISDRASRSDMSFTFGNEINGSLTWTNSSNDPNNYLSNGNGMADEIYGDLTINNNTQATLSIGLGSDEPLIVSGNVNLNSNTNSYPFYIDKITFFESDQQSLNLNFPGSDVFEIKEMYFRKDYSSYLTLKKDLKINSKLLMGIGSGVIKTEATKMLIIGDTCIVTDLDPENGSMVEGPMKKIGNTAFSFPIGKIKPMGMLTDKQEGGQTEMMRGTGSNFYKAPLGISAPAETDAAFIAEYMLNNPINDGYDTTFHEPGLGAIQTDEYWKLTRESGASNVEVTLTYDDSHITQAFVPSGLKIAGWDGAKWLDWGNGGTTGTARVGTIKSVSPLTTYGPLALAIERVRKPIITISSFDSLVCTNTQLMVRFTLDTNALSGNIFRVQLSDQNGSFDAGTTILGSKTTFRSDSIIVTIPNSLIPGNQYRIRIIGTQQGMISENAPLLIPQSKPQLSFTIEGLSEVCMGTGVVKYYPSVKEDNVTYNWTVSRGTFTIDNDTAFVTFTSAGTAVVKATPSNNCGNGTAVSRNITVKPAAPVTAPELTNAGRRLTASKPPAGQTVTFYNWYKNGTLIPGTQTSTYYASEAGEYTVEYANECGLSPVSNAITFANASIPQTITFDNLSDKVYGDEPFSLTATSNSELPVSYQIVSGPGNVTAGVFTITYSGTVVIRAYQLGDNQYDTAAPVIKSFVISKSPQTITFDSIPDYDFKGSTTSFALTGTSSSGKALTYTSSSGNITLNYGRVYVNGLGNVNVTASHPGDTNYLPAASITRTFCIRAMKLNPVSGAQYLCPGNQSVYRTNKIAGLTYSWRLSDGTTFPSTADSVIITWPATGTYTLIVSATGPCGPATPNDSFAITVMDASIAPIAATNMIPANGSMDQKLPLVLSWIPGSNTLSYDIFVWEDGTTKPANPFAQNISAVNYTLPKASLTYDKTYNWQVVSKNGCLQTNSSVQTFALRKLPDLTVVEVFAPASANSGQTVTINWKVKNVGGGVTTTNESWSDAVFLSFDSNPNFSVLSLGIPWSILDFPIKPLLVGTKKNVASLGIGEEYTNSIDVTLPRNLDQPIYVYVINNYKGGATAPLDADYSNDTAHAINPIDVTLTPTPDLRVDTVLAPATTFSGSKINVTYKVTNYGVLTPSGNTWKDKIYISKSPLFDKKYATVLKLSKQNETYYPAPEAVIFNNQQLENDQSVTKNAEVIIPNFITGTWFIHVVTNDGEMVYEGALANNNENNRPIQVILTPTPQFSINSINLPITQLSTTQPVGINWNVTNTGIFDNIEKNKGFYGKIIGTCSNLEWLNGRTGGQAETSNPLARGGGTGTVTVTYYPKEHDSLSWGSSYWTDKVYLSTDPSGLVTGNALYLGQATKGIKNLGWQMPDDIVQSQIHCGPGYVHGTVPGGTTGNVLRPGSNHPNNFNFKVPADLPEGDYYFYIQTNSTKTVFTYPDAPVISRSEKVTVSWPDLIVPSVTVPAAITGGSSFTLEYEVGNNGPGAVYEASRIDKIYVSNSSIFDETATLLKEVTFKESIGIDAPVSKSVLLSLPFDASGTKYFFIETNATKVFKEKSFGNNVSNATSSNVTSAPPADLEVTSVTVSDSIQAPGIVNARLYFEVKNSGANSANGETIDSIYISCDPVFNPSTAVFLTSKKTTRELSSGVSTLDSVNIKLDKHAYLMRSCFAKADFSDAYFFVKVNGNGGIYEAGDTTNNTGRSNKKTIVNRNIDLVVNSVSGKDSAIVGRPYKVDWIVTNIFSNSTLFQANRRDNIYFSKEPVFNTNAVAISEVRYPNSLITPLIPNNYTFSPLLPKMEAGDYYVFVVTNADDKINSELNRDNNSNVIRDEFGIAKKIHVELPLLSDLVSEFVTAPESVAVGQPVNFTYRVTNAGDGVTFPDKWWDEVWLMSGFDQNPGYAKGDLLFSSRVHSGNLEPGNSYEASGTATIPMNTPEGNYLLSTFTDKRNKVVENIDSNNVAWKPITVYIPAPSDLIVEHVSAPDTVYLGEAIDLIEWRVKNNSSNGAKGISTDGVYLSKGEVFDSSSVLIGIINKNMDLNPLDVDTLSLSPVINNVPEGDYNVIVRTDLLNNIFESDKTNNENHSLIPVHVAVKELHLDIPESAIMKEGRYYKLVIPDSLAGSTILLTLKSEDSLSVRNEMYVGNGYVPSVTTFDYKFNTPNYGNQQILITDVTASVYYISMRCVSPNPQPQNITLNAVKLPFAILYVQSNKGGNGGNVTVKLTGSLFADSMTAKISNGGTTIQASKVYFVNSTVAYATFPLQGKPVGIYDVVLEKTDRSETVLSNGFSIVSPDNGGLYSGSGVNTGATGPGTEPGCDPGTPAGLNSQLVTEMIIPEKVFGGWPFVIQINYSNPTNMDIPVQTRILYNDHGLPMSLIKGDEKNGNTSSLYIEMSETDGPPGVLRAGSSGTIRIYSLVPVSIPGHTHVKFNLK